MVAKSWMYDAIMYLYALSLLFYFSDFVGKSRRAKQTGTGLLAFVWVLQTLFFFMRASSLQAPAAFSMFDSLFFYSWLIVTLSLALNFFMRMDLFLLFINLVGFAVSALNFFSDEYVSPLLARWDIQDELLFVHVSLAIAGYAAFTVSAVLCGMYLILNSKLKRKKWDATAKRLPNLKSIETGAYLCVLFGTPLFVSSLVLGVVWIVLTGENRLLLDPKVLNSLIIIAAYGFYLIQRIARRKPGSTLVRWNLAAFAFVVANYAIFNWVSQFHQWIWR
ncbi:MAG TPA: cytochrome c biogenesis protein CcsA [Bacilli bacterium]